MNSINLFLAVSPMTNVAEFILNVALNLPRAGYEMSLHMYHRCPAQNIERETNIVRLPVAILGNLYPRACDMLRSVAWKFSKTLGKMLGSFGSQIGPPKRNRYR